MIQQIGASFWVYEWINDGMGTQVTVQVACSVARMSFSNSTPFSMTNGIWWPKLDAWRTNSTNCVDSSIVPLAPNLTAQLTSRWVLPPASVTNSEWFPMSISDATTLAQNCGRTFMAAEWTRLLALAAASNSIPYWYYNNSYAPNHDLHGSGQLSTPIPDLTSLPYYQTEFDSGGPDVTYRLQFSALTDYLNHAPVR